MSKLNATLVIAMASVLAAPCIALAENVTLTYGGPKVEYKEQKADGPRDAASGLPTGKRMHKPITITKGVSPASTNLTTTTKTNLTTTTNTGVKSNINGTSNSGLKR
jgi:type VI protein secretion system component Hcp